MASSKSRVQTKQLAAILNEEIGEKPKEPERIDLGDTAGLKRALVDATVESIAGAGYTIDHTYTDTKIVLGLLACFVACVGQFWPAKDPWNHAALIFSVSSYVILSILMTVHAVFIEKETVALTKAAGPAGVPLQIAAKLPRFSDIFTLVIRPKDAAADDRSNEVQFEKSVGSYFDSTGVLVKDALNKDVLRLLSKIEQLTKKTQ